MKLFLSLCAALLVTACSSIGHEVASGINNNQLRGTVGKPYQQVIYERPDLGKLIEYNTSCAPVFVQRAGIAAVKEGEPVIARTRYRFRKARDFLVSELRELPKVEVAVPTGTMYAFFRVQGVKDSLKFCKDLVREVGLGLAPGSAFGAEGEGFVRWCFAASEEKLGDGVTRLKRFL